MERILDSIDLENSNKKFYISTIVSSSGVDDKSIKKVFKTLYFLGCFGFVWIERFMCSSGNIVSFLIIRTLYWIIRDSVRFESTESGKWNLSVEGVKLLEL